MGHIAVAECACGFRSEELFCGGGLRNHQTTCNAPMICVVCGHVGTVNIKRSKGLFAAWVDLVFRPGPADERKQKPFLCPKCGTTNITVAAVKQFHSRLQKPPIAKNAAEDGQTVFFQAGPFTCSACGKPELMLRKTGRWD